MTEEDFKLSEAIQNFIDITLMIVIALSIIHMLLSLPEWIIYIAGVVIS
jgi:hypothetical protein